MSKSIASLAFEGAKDLFKLTGKGIAGTYKESASLLEATGAKEIIQKHPWRYTSSAAALGTSVGLAGMAGVGPLSSFSDMYTKNMIAQYGDRPDTRKTITATQTTATLGAIGFGITGGAGLFGFGPLGKDYTKTAGGISSKIKGIPLATAALGKKISRGSKKYWTKISAPVKNHPVLWGTALGAAAGAGVAISTDQYSQLRGGSEGNIIGINSSPTGGISPELQFSTRDLMFALHRNNKSVKARYQ